MDEDGQFRIISVTEPERKPENVRENDKPPLLVQYGSGSDDESSNGDDSNILVGSSVLGSDGDIFYYEKAELKTSEKIEDGPIRKRQRVVLDESSAYSASDALQVSPIQSQLITSAQAMAKQHDKSSKGQKDIDSNMANDAGSDREPGIENDLAEFERAVAEDLVALDENKHDSNYLAEAAEKADDAFDEAEDARERDSQRALEASVRRLRRKLRKKLAKKLQE